MRLGIKTLLLSAGALAAVSLVNPPAFAQGKVFRWANDGDVNSMDPYARNETFLLSFLQNVYEPLIRRDGSMKMQPALATAWKLKSPTVWEFTLRQDVKFSDGTPFNSDDVVFSYTRAQAGGSNMKGYFASVKEVRKTGPYTVEVETKVPDPLLADKLAGILIMSKVWADKNGAAEAVDLTSGKENFATRNAMGTGPFMLKSREPDSKTVLVRNPNWWDKTTKFNIDTAELNVIPNAATRTAALRSGQVDFVYTVPPADEESLKKDANIKVLSGRETRVVYLGFDQERNELLESNIKGKNPFKDVRVRQAFWMAIDEDGIVKSVMRGNAYPVALMIGQGISGYYKDLDVRPKFDVAAAKKLLSDAGYPNGFEVGMDCPNDRYVNDEAICKAVVTMLSKIGVKVNLNAQTRAKYFAKILRKGDFTQGQTSFFMLGWSPGSTYDAADVYQQLVETPDATKKVGGFNPGGYSNKKVDELADQAAQETDPKKREAMLREAAKLHRDDVGHIPLHQQAIVWAMRKNVDVVQRADNIFMLYNVNMK
jgi:peptide/nickel transport system substrate-binding protein